MTTPIPSRKYVMGRLVKPAAKPEPKRRRVVEAPITPVEVDQLQDAECREIIRFQDLKYE